MLTHDSLVRAEEHPVFCAYFKMLQTGALSFNRVAAIMDTKGIDSRILATPNNMLPLSPRAHSNKPGPMRKPLDLPVSHSRHTMPIKPRYKSGAHDVDLPPIPYRPLPLEPVRGGAVPVQPNDRWASMVMDSILKDHPYTLRIVCQFPSFDLGVVVLGGKYGGAFSLGRSAFAFFTEEQFKRQEPAVIRRLDSIVQSEGKARLPFEMEQIHHIGRQRMRHSGGAWDNSTLIFDRVVLGDTLLHLAARSFSPEIAFLLIDMDIDIEATNKVGEHFLDLFNESLEVLRATRLPPPPPRKFSVLGENAGLKVRTNGHLIARTSEEAEIAKREDAKLPPIAISSVVQRRFIARKREEREKVEWLRRCAEEVRRRMIERIKEVQAIKSKIYWVEMVGDVLSAWEQKRLTMEPFLEGLLCKADVLIAKADPTSIET